MTKKRDRCDIKNTERLLLTNPEASNLLGENVENCQLHGNNCVPITMLELQRKKMEDHLQTTVQLYLEQMKKMQEKYDAIPIKDPVLEGHAEEIESLRRELELEKGKQRENEQYFGDCVEKLMEEIVQAHAKSVMLEGRIVDMEICNSRHSETSVSPSAVSVSSMSPVQAIDALRSFPIETSRYNPVQVEDNYESESNREVEVAPTQNKREKLTNMPCKATVAPFKFICICGATFDLNRVDAIEKHTSQTCGIRQQFHREVFRKTITKSGKTTMKRVRFLSSSDNEIVFIDDDQINKSQSNEVCPSLGDTDSDFIHRSSTQPGRYLPVSCTCGREFSSEEMLWVHVRNYLPFNSEYSAGNQTPVLLLSPNGAGLRHGEDPFHSLGCLCGMQCQDNLALYNHIKYFTGVPPRRSQPRSGFNAETATIENNQTTTQETNLSVEEGPSVPKHQRGLQQHGKVWRELDKDRNVNCQYWKHRSPF